MSAQSRRFAVVIVLLIGALLAEWIPSLIDSGKTPKRVVEGSTGASHLFIADTDPYAQSGDQTLIASPYDLGLGGLAGFPTTLANWTGQDIEEDGTERLGLKAYQQVFRSYSDDQGRLVWLRLLATSDWQVFDHRPPICYFYNNYNMGPENKFSLPLGVTSLPMREFVARQGEFNHLVLYTFLWPDHYRDMAQGATMVELVTPYGDGKDDRDKAARLVEEFARLAFTGNPATLPQASVSALQHPLDVNLDNKVNLLGYDLSTSAVKPGKSLRVTLYWQARDNLDEDYTVFVHLLGLPTDPMHPILMQVDRQPFDGMYPTSKWSVGQVVEESYELTIPEGIATGDRELEVGMYLLATQRRLGVVGASGSSAGDRVLLSPVRIGNPATP